MKLIDTIVSLAMSLILPAIGYLGVRYHDRCVIGLVRRPAGCLAAGGGARAPRCAPHCPPDPPQFCVCSLGCVMTSSFSILFLAMTTVFVDRTPSNCASADGKVQDCSDDSAENKRLRALFFLYASFEVVGCLLSVRPPRGVEAPPL